MNLHPGFGRRHATAGSQSSVLDPIRRALQEDEDWYQDLVEHSQDVLAIHDLEGRLLSINPTPARLTGYSVEEMLQIPLRDLIAPEFRAQFDQYLIEIENTGESSGSMAVITRSGERRIWEYHNTLRREGVNSPIVRCMAHDVSDLVRKRKALRATHKELLKKSQEQERALHELKLFRELVDHSNDAIEVVEPENLRFLDANEKACSSLGYSREELLSRAVFDIDPMVTPESFDPIRRRLKESGSLLMRSVHRRKDGSIFPVEVNIRLVHLEREYFVAVARDLSERNDADTRLRASENRYRAIHDSSPVGICRTEYETGRFLEVNPKYCEIVGRTAEELLGMNFQSITHPDDLPQNWRIFQRLAAGELQHYEMEKRYVRPDGEVRWVEASVVAIGSEGERRGWTLGMVQDITDRKQAEERLKEYERVVEGLEEMIVVIDRDYRYVLANRAALDYRGLEREQLIGHAFGEQLTSEGTPEQRIKVLKQKMEECFQGKVIQFETKHTYREQGEQHLLLSYFPIEGAGAVDRIACIVRDITERKRAEERLREYERVVEGLEEMIVVVDREFRYVIANRAYLNYRNISREEVIGRRVDEVVDKNVFESVVRERMDECFAGKVVNYPLKYTYPGVGERELFVSYFPIEGPTGVERLAAILQDVTESKRAEQSLRQSEERFRVALKHSPITVFNLDRDVRYTWMHSSPPVGPPSLYLGKTPHAFYGAEEGERIFQSRLQVLKSGTGTRQETKAVLEGKTCYFDTTIEPVFDSDGGIVGLAGASMDITDRRLAEEALRQNLSKLQAVSEELRLAKEKLSEEKIYLEQAIDTELGFGEIIGRSSALKQVMENVARVAPSDATVLLLGETGTGKELVARALHRLSNRKENSFIKLNCAAIPSGLLESELFGHEKGAFTGAVSKKIGRLELADQGTLFLDEIGDIPLELQPKLLRVLQDQEFERLGGTQTLKVNFRLVAATNRELLHSVRQRQFRSDLFYRLSVFPIHLPALRERREDIPLLIEYFVRKCAIRMNKSIISIPAKSMEKLVQWAWPGNIRELENFVERSVILTPGSVLQVPLSELINPSEEQKSERLNDLERGKIILTLRECNGKLGGPNGAAARLGLKRTTLQSKLANLGINRLGIPVTSTEK